MGTQVISIVLLASLRHNVSFSLTNCNHVHGSVLVLHFGEQKMPSQLFMQGRMAVLPARAGGMHEAPSHTGAQTAWCFVYLYYTYLYYICIVFVLYLYYICITFVLYLYCIVIIFVLYNKRGHKLPEKMCSKQTCSTQNLCLSFLMVTDHWSVTRPPTVLLFPFSLPLSKVTNSWDRSAHAFSKAVSN